MSALSAYDLSDIAGQQLARRHRLQDERRFRVEQLAALGSELSGSHRHDSVKVALYVAASTALSEINAALARMEDGRYGFCVNCSKPIPPARLDVLPMAPLCMPCHYYEQSAGEQSSTAQGHPVGRVVGAEG